MNKKYILIVSFLILTYILGLEYPSNFTQIIAPLFTLILIAHTFKNEIKAFNFNSIKDKNILEQSLYSLAIAAASQTLFNIITFSILGKPHTSIVESTITPFIGFSTIALAPVLEEVVCRKIIFGSIQGTKVKFSILAASISSFLFALGHMSTYGSLGYYAVGMVFCYFYFKTKNILTTVFAHMMFNFLVILIQSLHMAWGLK